MDTCKLYHVHCVLNNYLVWSHIQSLFISFNEECFNIALCMLRLQIFVVERCIVQYSTTRLYQHTDCSEVMSMLSEHPYEAILLVGI